MTEKANILSLYERYSRLVYALSWQYRCEGAEPDDLVQEVWLRLCEKGAVLCDLPQERQIGYLAAVVRNTACSLARKATHTLPLEAAGTIGYQESAMLNDMLDRQCSVQKFRELWPSVPQPAAELLERKYLMQESDAQIAHAMGIAPGSVRMYLTRARRTALDVLGAYRDKLL